MFAIKSIGNVNDFSTTPPVLGRKILKGGKPKRNGIGNNHGTPSSVKVSIIKWEMNPIINDHQIISISTSKKVFISRSKNHENAPKRKTPINE